MTVLAIVAAIVLGFGAGVLSGMFGVGGAVVTTPGIRVLGATPIEAVGSTLPAILPGALSGALRYDRAGLVNRRVAITCGLLGSGFAVLGGIISDHVNAHGLMLLTAALLLWTGVRNIIPQRTKVAVVAADGAGDVPVEASVDPSVDLPVDLSPSAPATAGAEIEPPASLPKVAAIGAGAGLLAGLLGVGGGILMVPAFTQFLRMPPKRAVATSLGAVAMFSIPAMITHARLGHIDWALALALVVGVIPGAQIGAHLTIRHSERRLRLLMGVLFSLLALGYGISELRSL